MFSHQNNDDGLSSVQNSLDATDKVFRIDLLLDTILTHVIFEKRDYISRNNLRSVRLVNKLWLETASRLIEGSKGHVCKIYLKGNSNKLRNGNSGSIGVNRHPFISTFSSKNHLEISFLPVFVFISAKFFRTGNYYSLHSLVTKCGQQLKALTIEFPLDGGSIPVRFSQFSFPNLLELCFRFSDTNSEKDWKNEFGNNSNGLALLQSILNASPNLKEFQLCSQRKYAMPDYVETLHLPQSITSISLKQELTRELTELLLRNELPVLQHIWLNLDIIKSEQIFVFKILDRFRKTLKSVEFFRVDGLTVTFPLMESLKELSLTLSLGKFSTGNTPLQNFMPNLNKINLNGNLESWIIEFTDLGGLNSVQEICLRYMDETNFETVHSELMEDLHKSFPNVQRLSMYVDVTDVSGLNYVLGRMKQLKKLEIEFCGELDENSSEWIEPVLTGISEEDQQPSLLNLTELRELHLTTKVNLKDGESSLLTNAIFEKALQKMLKLQILFLSRKFQPTVEMQEEWKKQGRIMEYQIG